MANSAVVGILKALLTADVADFTAKMSGASDDVKKLGEALQKDLEPRQRAVNAAVRDFLGGKEIQRAEEYAQAVAKIGGADKLTEQDQLRVNKAMNEALGHYAALGQQAPAHLVKLQQETEKTSASTGFLQGKWASLAAAFTSGIWIDRAISGLINLGKEVIADAGHLVDLSQKTGLSIRSLQIYGQIAKETGGSVDTVADAVFKLGVNIENGEKKTSKQREALERLGLEYDKIRALKPEEQFQKIADKLHNVENVQERNSLGVALFGKAWKEVAPAVVEGLQSIIDKTVIVGDEQVKAIDRASDAWDRFIQNQKRGLLGFLGGMVLAKELADNLKSQSDAGSTWAKDTLATYMDLLLKNKNQEAVEFIIKATERHKDVLLETAKASKKSGDAEGDRAKALKDAEKATKDAEAAAWKRKEAEAALNQVLMNGVFFDVTKVAGKRVTLGPSPSELDAVEKLIMDQQLYTAFVDESVRRLKDEELWIRKSGAAAQGVLDIFNKLPGKRIELPDPPDPKPYRETATAMGFVSDELNYIAQNSSGSFSAMANAAAVSTRLIQGYFASLSAGMQASAAAAQIAWGAATFGFGYIISKQAEIYAEDKRGGEQARKNREKLLADIRAFGAEPITMAHIDTRGIQGAIDLEKALQKQLKDLQDQAEHTQQALLHVGQSGKTWQELQDLAEELGIDVKALGPAFESLRLDELGKKYVDAWQTFKKAGTDNLVVLRGMKDEINGWLKDAQNAGIKIPEYMRPILQALADDGELTDAAGRKLEDLSSLDFAPDLEQGLTDVATGLGDVESAIRDLIAVLTGDFTGALQHATVETDKWVLDTKTSVSGLARHIHDELGGLNFGIGVRNPDVPGLDLPTFGGGALTLAGASTAEALSGYSLAPQNATFIIEQDGLRTARATVPYLPDEVRRVQLGR